MIRIHIFSSIFRNGSDLGLPRSVGAVRSATPIRVERRSRVTEHPKGEGADGSISNAYLEEEPDGRNSMDGGSIWGLGVGGR